MPSQTIETDPGPDDSKSTPNGPGEGPMGPAWIVAVALYLVFASVLVLYGLLKLWPYPTPSGELGPKAEGQAETSRNTGAPGARPAQSGSSTTAARTTASPNVAGASEAGTPNGQAVTETQTTPATVSPSSATTPRKRELPDPEVIFFFRGRFPATIYLETRLLLLVMLAGALGSLMHSLRSLYWYTGNRMMVWSWVGFYVLLPFTGAMLSVIFYFVVRGGFFSPQASFENTSPFGFAALSALVGLFSPQATLKLKEIAETIFTKPGAGADSSAQATTTSQSNADAVASTAAPSISSVTPVSGSSAIKVVIGGTGFAPGLMVKFGGVPALVTSTSENSIEVIAPATISDAGLVDVEVTNADGQRATLSQGFTYLAFDSVASGAAEDDLDGHDVEIKPDTADEDLPVTEGGVE